MKKSLFTLVTLLTFLLNSYSQFDTVYVNGVPTISRKGKPISELGLSPLVKDDYVLDLSYGVPFMPVKEADVFGLNLFENTTSGRIVGGFDHICAGIDYLFNSEYGVGLELTYATIQYQYVRTLAIRSGTNITVRDSSFKTTASKVRFLAKVSYHYNISEKFDAFTTAGFGYKQFKYGTKDSYLTTGDVLTRILPVAIRLSLGGRFFISKQLAIHVEGEVGGPIMQAGISYKMH